MPWNDFLGGDNVTSSDPLEAIRAIASAIPGADVPQNAVTSAVGPARVPPLPKNAVPAKPLPPSPTPVGPGPVEHAVTPGGSADWKALLEQVGPLLGAFAMHDPAQRTGFLNGWMHGAELAKQERTQRDQQLQARNQAAANYKLEVGQHAMAIADPVQRAQFVDLAEQSGMQAGLMKKGDLADLRAVPASQAAAAQLQELTDKLAGIEKNGYNLDDLAKAGAALELKDGRQVPIATALDLTRARPIDASGAPIVKPASTGKTAEERFLAKWAKDRNKTVDNLTAAEELQAKTDFANAGKQPEGDDFTKFVRSYAAEFGTTPDKLTTAQQLEARQKWNGATRNPQLDEINLSLKQLQLEDARRKAKEAGASSADIVPGSKEYKVAEDLATGRITFSQLRTLYAYSRDVGKKIAIYDKATEINPNFSPAAFEMGYKFASNPKTQQQMASINNVLTGVPDLVKASDAAARSGVTLLNQFIVPAGIAVGGKKYSNFKTAQIAFADELSGALGYGSATDMSREMGFNMTNPNLSPENFKSALQDIVIPFVNRKKASLLGPMGPYGTPGLNPVAAPPTDAPSGPLKVGGFTVTVK